MFAEVAIDAPVYTTFDYAIPVELDGQLCVGQLVQVAFATAMQHGIILRLHDDAPLQKAKPIVSLLDPRPVVNEAQIELARWMAHEYLAPFGLCLFLWLPAGLTGQRDILVTPLKTDIQPREPLEAEIVGLLLRRGPLRGHNLNLALAGKPWRAAVEGLHKAGVVRQESILTPPRARPKIVQTAALAIHPDQIPTAVRALERPSRAADLLETLAAANGSGMDLRAALKASGAAMQHVEKLADEGAIRVDGEQVAVQLEADALTDKLAELRKLDKPLRILRLLAREGDAVDVSWIYAQADAALRDLQKLEEENLILLGEAQKWRATVEASGYVSTTPPALTAEQAAAWEPLRAAILGQSQATPASPRIRGGEQDSAVWSEHSLTGGESGENFRQWQVPQHLSARLSPLAKQVRAEPTRAEEVLWQALRGNKLGNHKFRRQHPIERFIVDFYCAEAKLILEVDGEVHQYTQAEDAVRQEVLESLGLQVLRFTNEQVLDDLQLVTQAIIEALERRVPAFSPRPEFGEGLGVGSHASVFLLHGVTGSGKTEIYLRAIELTLALGRNALFLVPEIALTPQTARRAAARFPGRVAVVHSGISDGERYDTWRRARQGLVQVIVGARSALFSPLPDIGLIVLDEEHDPSYKQSEPIPNYHVRAVAEEIVRRNHGVLLLGSATPDVESVYRAAQGQIVKLELPNRIMGHRARIQEQSERAGVLPRYKNANADGMTIDLPPVRVVDMRAELKAGNTNIFSRALQTGLGKVLERGEQAILFLNRRGQSTYVFCRDCGYVAKCPNCETPLTHHRQGAALRCHRCGHEQGEPTACPVCRSRRIKYFGAGTQQVEQALIELYPSARVARWDGDTASSHEMHEAILQRFIERRTDIIVGTQMVTKGLDLPLVTLVGVVSADVGLALPDFRAGERTFQLLTQVAGRAGRGLLGGQVILQTYQPDHYVIRAAADHDYAGFYTREVTARRELGYPPYRRLVRLLFRFPNETKARAEAERAAGMLRHRLKMLGMTGTDIIGPAPCFFTKDHQHFRWQLLLRGPDPAVALRGLDLPRGWHVDVDPVEVL